MACFISVCHIIKYARVRVFILCMVYNALSDVYPGM